MKLLYRLIIRSSIRTKIHVVSNQEEIEVLALDFLSYMLKHLLIIWVHSMFSFISKVSIFQKNAKERLLNSKFGKSNLKKTKNKYRSKNKLERAIGCVIGAFVADSSGGTLECNNKHNIN
jgi:hypothetical protein